MSKVTNEPRILDPRDFVSARVWMIGQILGYALLALMLVRYAYARITGVPAAMVDGRIVPLRIDPLSAAELELLSSLRGLAPLDPNLVEWSRALSHDWDAAAPPEGIRRLMGPEWSGPLDRVVAALSTAVDVNLFIESAKALLEPNLVAASGEPSWENVTLARDALTVRARCHWQGGAIEPALRDLSAGVRLNKRLGLFPDSGRRYGPASFEALPEAELTLLALSGRLSDEQARRAFDVLAEQDGLDPAAIYVSARGAPDEIERLLDYFFTGDRASDGWSVPSVLQDTLMGRIKYRDPPGHAAWNLVASTYFGREAVRNRLAVMDSTMLKSAFGDPNAGSESMTICGPAILDLRRWRGEVASSLYRAAESRLICATAVMLAAHRASTGDYPDRLTTAIPPGAPQAFRDWVARFRYARKESTIRVQGRLQWAGSEWRVVPANEVSGCLSPYGPYRRDPNSLLPSRRHPGEPYDDE